MNDRRLQWGPVGEAEVLIGKRHNEWSEEEQLRAIAVAMRHGEDRAKHFDEAEDTHYNAPFSRTVSILLEHGWRRILQEDSPRER
ncbi:hypothetical protein LCGC14_2731390, partial [marine sediment metagenome]